MARPPLLAFAPPPTTGLVVRVQHDPRHHSAYAWVSTAGFEHQPYTADVRYAQVYYVFESAKAEADARIAAGFPSLIWEVSISRRTGQPDRPIRMVWPVENIIESVAALDHR